MTILILLNNFLHDFGAAGWVFGAVAIWSLLRMLPSVSEPTDVVITVLKTHLFLMRLSFVAIVVFGVIRALAYKSFEWNEAAGQSQVTLLLVKHLVFALVFALGLIPYIRACRVVKRAR